MLTFLFLLLKLCSHRTDLFSSNFSFPLTMPRTCQIKGCKKTAKLMSENITPPLYLCQLKDDEHNERRLGLTFKKLVNSPCITCVDLNEENVKEATFGPLLEGKLKRMYCKAHSNVLENMTGKKSIRRCEHDGCEIEPRFLNDKMSSSIIKSKSFNEPRSHHHT